MPAQTTQQIENIVIIGAGIIGSCTAYYLTRHPSYDPSRHKITLLEASAVAGGASGKAGGLLALWAYPRCLVPLSYSLHAELAQEHNGAERWGYRRLHCGELQAKARRQRPHRRSNGTSPSTTTVSDSKPLPKRDKDAVDSSVHCAGVPEDLDWFTPDCIKSYDSMGDPSNTAQVHPHQFTSAMASLAEQAGVRIIFGSVTSINSNDDSASPSPAVRSVTYTPRSSSDQDTEAEAGAISYVKAQQTLPATKVILAAGPWTQSIYATAPISATRAHSITIRPSRPISAYAVFTQISGRDRNHNPATSPEIYARPNDEVYACGEADDTVPLPKTSADVQVDLRRCADIEAAVAAVSDEMRDGEVTARQACYLPTVDAGVDAAGPLIGQTSLPGLIIAAGHSCWGIQNGPGTGKLVSEIVMEGRAKSADLQSLDPRRVM
ncbi:MAG: hypothetical protein M1825_004154 [Sarcosagium campestre]|nr:MAG: hypothetical protein M1825_004154 [Sarcosagium campestre]